MKLFKWLKWLWRGKPMVYYDGYNCGCCGIFVHKPFSVRDYEFNYYDRWGLCDNCKNMSGTDQFYQIMKSFDKRRGEV